MDTDRDGEDDAFDNDGDVDRAGTKFFIFLVSGVSGKLTLNNTTISGGCTFDLGGGGDAVSGSGIAVIGGSVSLNNSAVIGGVYSNAGSVSISR